LSHNFQKEYEDLIQSEINKQTWACKLIVARTEEEKYSALAV